MYFVIILVLDRRYRQDRTGGEDESEIYSISSRGVSFRGKGLSNIVCEQGQYTLKNICQDDSMLYGDTCQMLTVFSGMRDLHHRYASDEGAANMFQAPWCSLNFSIENNKLKLLI